LTFSDFSGQPKTRQRRQIFRRRQRRQQNVNQ